MITIPTWIVCIVLVLAGIGLLETIGILCQGAILLLEKANNGA